MRIVQFSALILFACFVISAVPSLAAGGGETPPKQEWSFKGPFNMTFGTYERDELQRGYKVYRQVCAACHGMDLISYRNLADLGYNEAEVKAIAAEYTIMDGPNDEGEMFDRPGIPADRFVNPYPNAQAAKYANNGAYPPDLSLIAKARPYGADYIYALLAKGYVEPPEGKTLLDGQHYNKYMAGNVIAMASPLSDGLVAYEDGSKETVSQFAHDVSAFLMWAAEPKLEDRTRMGYRVILFLIVFAGVMYAVKKKIWSDLH